MIKRTLYFSSPVYLRTKDEQLVFNIPNAQGMDELGDLNKVPIEDLGIVILDHQQITISHGLMAKLLANNVALITCDHTHHPTGLFLNLDGHTLQSARFQAQIEATLPLKKQMWQQTIKAKIINQAMHLQKRGIENRNMLAWAEDVKSGDIDNMEARAAAYYWKTIFTPLSVAEGSGVRCIENLESFYRKRDGLPPNNLLNYGYAILRAITARSLVGSGLMPTLGIHHRNQYNAYCLADDIMEPYRPYVDEIVYEIIACGEDFTELNKAIKQKVLGIATVDTRIEGERSPLMIGLTRTTASVSKCYEGEIKKIVYPVFQ